MTEPTNTEGLELKLANDLKHTLKLVPSSQRKLFVYELAQYLRNPTALADTKVTGMASLGASPTPDVANPPTPPPSPAMERARLEAKIDEIYGLITPIYADPFFEPDYVLNLRGHDLIGRINELQAALDKLDKEQK